MLKEKGPIEGSEEELGSKNLRRELVDRTLKHRNVTSVEGGGRLTIFLHCFKRGVRQNSGRKNELAGGSATRCRKRKREGTKSGRKVVDRKLG